MAHLIETMAYAGATPWHCLGKQLTQKQPMHQMRILAGRKVQWHESMGFFMKVLCDVHPTVTLHKELPNERTLRKVQELYKGKGKVLGFCLLTVLLGGYSIP